MHDPEMRPVHSEFFMRTRKAILLAVLALLLLSLASSVGAQDSDAYLLPILADGESVEGAFLTMNDAHLYAFQGTAGDLVTITMQQTDRDSFLDPYLALLGQAGQVYAVNDDSADDNDPVFASAIVDFALPETGSYFIVATTLGGSSGFGSDDTEGGPFGYELSASGFTLPEGADPESFLYSGSSVEIGQSNTLYSNATEPVYFVDFIGEVGQVIDVKTTTDTVTDTILWLFAPNGIRIAINDDSNGTAAELLGVELPEDGKYFMFATGYGFLNAADGSYSQDGNFGISVELVSGASK
jgi:hypothetical protein